MADDSKSKEKNAHENSQNFKWQFNEQYCLDL